MPGQHLAADRLCVAGCREPAAFTFLSFRGGGLWQNWPRSDSVLGKEIGNERTISS